MWGPAGLISSASLSSWCLLQSCLLALGCGGLLMYQNCLFLAKRMLQPHRRGYAVGHALNARLLQTQLCRLWRFPRSVPDLSSAVSAVLAARALRQRTRDAPWPASSALLAAPRPASVSRGGAAAEWAVCCDVMDNQQSMSHVIRKPFCDVSDLVMLYLLRVKVAV